MQRVPSRERPAPFRRGTFPALWVSCIFRSRKRSRAFSGGSSVLISPYGLEYEAVPIALFYRIEGQGARDLFRGSLMICKKKHDNISLDKMAVDSVHVF